MISEINFTDMLADFNLSPQECSLAGRPEREVKHGGGEFTELSAIHRCEKNFFFTYSSFTLWNI